MKMRKLKTSDIFTMSKILKKIGLKIESEGKTQAQLGADMFMSFLENMHQAEDEMATLFGDLLGITKEDFLNLSIEESLEAIQLFKEQDGLKHFLSILSK